MAIGDNNNSNLFGTNYNSEEEERKKAELAAQNARIGAAGGTQGSNQQGGFFEPGGFGYENLGPRLVKNTKLRSELLGQFLGEQLYGTGITAEGQPTGFPVDRPSLAGDILTLPGTALNVVGDFVTDPILASVELAKDAASYVTGESGVQSQQEALEAAQAAAALEATQGVTPPVERPLAGAQEQPSAVVSPFLQSPDTPSGLGGPLLRGFEMVNDAARGPNAPMGQDATRAALGGMTLNEYLNAPAGTPGVSGLRTDPQGRMIPTAAQLRLESEVAQPPVDGDIIPAVEQPPVNSAAPTAVAQLPVDSAVPPAVAQPPVDALSSFEQDSLERQQRIGGTGSFEGDSDARDARLRANERQPGESQTERDTRVAQSRTTGSQAGGMSFDDARRRAEGQLAARGVKNPSASMVNDLARGIQAGEPERLAELETKRAKDAVELKTAQATLDRPEFEGRVYTVNGVTFAQTSRGGAQVIDTGTETSEESTAKMKDFVFALEQIDKAREAFAAGDLNKANDIFTAAGIQKNGFDVTASEYFGGSAPSVTDSGLTQQQIEAGIQRVMADNEITREEAIKALEKERPEIFKVK